MNQNFLSNSLSGKHQTQFEVTLPKVCPHCNHAIAARITESSYCKVNSGFARVGMIYFCHHCENFFFGMYVAHDFSNHAPLLSSSTIFPYPRVFDTFSDRINALSPDFVEIYHQSQSAENHGLMSICGMGYRKALEFLVKDYAIHLHPDDEESIKSKMLSPCIQTYIDNNRIKSLAIASAWIGNDETHYVRKQEDYDVSDLKVFIQAAVAFIDSDLVTEAAAALISSK